MEKTINPPTANLGNSSSEKPVKNSGGSSAGLKVAVFFSFVLALVSLGGSGWLYQSLNAERRDRQALEGAQDQIREKSLSLEKVTEGYKSQIDELQEKLQSGENERVQFKAALEENRNLIAGLQEKLKAAEELKNKALELQAQKAAPALSVTDEEGSADSDFEEAPAGSQAPATAAAPAVQKKSAVPAIPAAAAPVVRAPQVLTVNRKFNFVVVSLGVKDGIQMGDAIEILRSDKVIGNVQVEKLYENFAAATIVQETKENPIKEGDSIRKLTA